MPTYQYECDACNHAFDVLQSMLDKKLTKCPQCGKNKLQRLIGAGSGIIFKGSGFYETDYKAKKTSTAGASSSKEESAKTTESKPDSNASSAEEKSAAKST